MIRIPSRDPSQSNKEGRTEDYTPKRRMGVNRRIKRPQRSKSESIINLLAAIAVVAALRRNSWRSREPSACGSSRGGDEPPDRRPSCHGPVVVSPNRGRSIDGVNFGFRILLNFLAASIDQQFCTVQSCTWYSVRNKINHSPSL